MHHPEMHGRMLPTRRGGCTILFLRPLHSVAAKLNTIFSKHNAGVSAKQSVRVSHAICMAASLDLTKTDPSTFRLCCRLNHTIFPTVWCLRTRSYTPNYRKF